MRILLRSVIILLASSGLSLAQEKPNLRGQPDNPTPRVQIIQPLDGAVLAASKDFNVVVETTDFDFAYHNATTPGGPEKLPEKYNQLPQRANSGHVHVYIASIGEKGEYKNFVMPQSFMMPQQFDTKNRGTIKMPGLAAGKYKLMIELVADDHTPRVKHHPRDWPSIDLISFEVR